jgi:hypothetical protein
MGQEAVRNLAPIVQDASLTAVQKPRHFFGVSLHWKANQKELISGTHTATLSLPMPGFQAVPPTARKAVFPEVP